MRPCFVRIEAGPLFFADDHRGIGGAEVRSAMFARTLAQRPEHEVSFVLGSFRPRAPESVDGIRVHFLRTPRRSRDRSSGLALCWQWPADMIRKLAQDIHARLPVTPRPWPFFNRLDADTLLCFGMQSPMINAIASARHSGKKSILFLVQDLDDDFPSTSLNRYPLKQIRDMQWRRWAVEHADCIVAQSTSQQETLRSRFGRESALIRNPIRISSHDPPQPPDVPPNFALWVGRSDHRGKRSDLCLELIRRNPQIPFVVVMNPCSDHDAAELEQLRRNNVVLLRRVPFDAIDPYYRHARVLVNTSQREGFPNTFLQAARWGVPIVTWQVDPDGILTRHGCGRTAGGCMDSLSELLNRLWQPSPEREAISQAGKNYVRRFHGLDERVAELEELIGQLHSEVRGKGKTRQSA